jgi:hypothetical protein
MDRRNFLKNTGTLVAAATLVPRVLSKASEQPKAANQADGWFFP